MDYYKGKIYKIVNSDNLCYYGSTTQTLEKRFIKHKSAYNVWLKGKSKNYCSSFEVLQGNNVKIELVLECMCFDKYELLKYEQNFIENNQCVNKKNYEDKRKEVVFYLSDNNIKPSHYKNSTKKLEKEMNIEELEAEKEDLMFKLSKVRRAIDAIKKRELFKNPEFKEKKKIKMREYYKKKKELGL